MRAFLLAAGSVPFQYRWPRRKPASTAPATAVSSFISKSADRYIEGREIRADAAQPARDPLSDASNGFGWRLGGC